MVFFFFLPPGFTFFPQPSCLMVSVFCFRKKLPQQKKKKKKNTHKQKKHLKPVQNLWVFFLFIIIYLSVVVLGLRCCVRAISNYGELGRRDYCSFQGMAFSLQWLLLSWSSWSMGSRHRDFRSYGTRALEHRLNSCGARAQLLRGICDLLTAEIEPMSPALAGGFFTTEPPGKSCFSKAG